MIQNNAGPLHSTLDAAEVSDSAKVIQTYKEQLKLAMRAAANDKFRGVTS